MSRARAWNKRVHPNTNKPDFHTPQFVLDYIKEQFPGRSMLDCAWSEELNNATAPTFDLFTNQEVPKDHFLFINPPWDTQTVIQFYHEAHRRFHSMNEDAPFCMLLPNKLTQTSWISHILPYIDHVCFLGGRLNFSGPWSTPGGSSRYGSILIFHGSKKEGQISFEMIRELKKRFSE
jgi:hypothetical protein